MITKEIKLGTKLELESINSLNIRIGQSFTSKLMDILDDRNFIIVPPIHERKILFIPIGSRIRVTFLHAKYGMQSFIATITKKEKADNQIYMHIQQETDYEKIQRRQNFRLDCTLDVKYRIVNEDSFSQVPENAVPDYKKALTKNISAGGAAIVTDDEIPKDSIIETIYYLDSGIQAKAICKIIRSSVIEFPKGKKYEYSIIFTDIHHKEKDKIVKFTFDMQRQLLKNSKI